MLIVLAREGIDKAEVVYIHIWGQTISGCVIYLLDAVKEINCGEDIIFNSLGWKYRATFIIELGREDHGYSLRVSGLTFKPRRCWIL